MKKIVSMMLVLATASALAGVVEPFRQFTQADFKDAAKPGQPWASANVFTLSVKANTTVWLSNYVSSFYDPKPLPDLDGNVFNMAPGKYGYINKNDLAKLDMPNGSYDSLIHWANGETTTITYTYTPNPSITNYTTGYLLDEFKEDAEIYLVMTTLASDGGETVDTYQYVQDAEHKTTMQSRQHDTSDLADNVRINFGIDSVTYGEIAREFVAVYTGANGGAGGGAGGVAGGGAGGGAGGHSGQPLPGLLFAGMLSLGTVLGVSKMRKCS